MPRISHDARRALIEERREQILKAAIEVFGEKGFERATIADVARRAGVAEGSIYNYFKNKGDLLVGIPRQIVQLPVQAIAPLLEQSNVPGAVSPEKVLTAIAQNLVAIFHQNSQIFRVLISAVPHLKQTTRESYVNHVILYAIGILEAYFKKQIELGVFRKDLDPRVLAMSFFGMLFPYVMLHEVIQVDAHVGTDYPHVIRQIVPLFLGGVLADASERK
jgi:AcrR family transcriptional regulator